MGSGEEAPAAEIMLSYQSTSHVGFAPAGLHLCTCLAGGLCLDLGSDCRVSNAFSHGGAVR